MKYLISLLIFVLCSLFVYAKAEEEAYVNYHIVNIDDPTPLEEIKNRYTSTDEIDGNITNKLQFETDYNENDCKLGRYKLKVWVTNSSSNTTSYNDIIQVIDITAPVVEVLESELSINLNTKPDIDFFFQYLKITDNVDTLFDLTITNLEDLENGPGNYILNCFVTDTSNNKSLPFKFFITANQTEFETITSDIIKLKSAGVSKDEILSLFLKNNNIKSGYDSIDIETNYLTNPVKNGIYQLKVITKFKDGTSQIYYSKIEVNIEESETSDYTIPLIFLGVAVSLTFIGIIIYKKRN